MVPPIEISGLTKRFPLVWRRGWLVAVDSLDLTVRAGEVFGLLGPNGSGKSTTLKILLGLMRQSAGVCRLFGQEGSRPDARARVGLLPENPYFHRFLSGEETLRFYGRLCGMSGASLNERIPGLLRMVGLSDAGHRRLGTYSKGMLQRIGLAQALVHDPELVLLDEPTAGVDPLGARDIKDLIIELKRQGKTVVLCSHLLEHVEEVCDRIAILHQGRKLVEGSLDELLRSGDRCELEVAPLPGQTLVPNERMAELVQLGGGRLEAVRPLRRSLEQLFMEHLASSTRAQQEVAR
jgi:ABC-2 type transport system ATP-binding protein